MKLRQLFSLFLLVPAFTSCITGKQLMKLKEQEAAGTAQFSDLKHVNNHDTYTTIAGVFGSQPGGESKINIGVRAFYQPIHLGEFGFTAVRHFYPSKGLEKYMAEKSRVMKFRIGASYELPLIKHRGIKESVVMLYDNNTHSSSYYTIMDVEHLDIWALKTGVAHYRNEITNTSYAESLSDVYDEIRFDDAFERGEMLIEQGSYIGKIGVSYSRIYGTTMRAINSEHDFTGLLFRKLNIYGQVHLLGYAQTDLIDFSYRYLNFSQAEWIEVSEQVNPSNFIPKKNIGFAVGSSFSVWGAPISNFVVGCYLEIGITPGYLDRLAQGTYAEFGLQIGFGNVTKR